MSEQKSVAGSSKSQSTGVQKGKGASTSETVAMTSPTSSTMVSSRVRPKLAYETRSSGFQQKGALPIPVSDPDHEKRTLALALVSIVMSLLITTSTLLWLKLTGGIIIASCITFGLWLTYFSLVPRIAAGVDNWFNRNRPYCVLCSREDVMYSTSGFASLVGFAFTILMLA